MIPLPKFKDYPFPLLNFNNERDIEVSLLVDFIHLILPDTLLDVGACYSHYYYAKQIRKYVRQYDGIDLKKDEITEQWIDTYYTENFLTFPLNNYDTIISISTLEHIGVTDTYNQFDFYKCVDKLLNLTNKYVFLTFPVGQEYFVPNSFCMICNKKLSILNMLRIKHNFNFFSERYFYTQGSPAGYGWKEHDNAEWACSVPFVDFIGAQSIAIWVLEKT